VRLAPDEVLDRGVHLVLVDEPVVVEQVVGERQIGGVGELAGQGGLCGRQAGVEGVRALGLDPVPGGLVTELLDVLPVEGLRLGFARGRRLVRWNQLVPRRWSRR
jgi:hypothetical protein